MLRLTVFIFLCTPVVTFAQNAIGFSAGYSYLNHRHWEKLVYAYNMEFDTAQRHPVLHHLPGACFIYERKMSEFLYVQPFLQYQRAQTVSENGRSELKLNVQFLGAGIGINWYPVKMAKGQRKNIFNPFYLRIGLGVSYALNKITLGNKTAFNDSIQGGSSSNLSLNADAGFGYDLHFGKRVVFQPFFGARFYPVMNMQSMEYFIVQTQRFDLPDAGFAWAPSAMLSLLFLF